MGAVWKTGFPVAFVFAATATSLSGAAAEVDATRALLIGHLHPESNIDVYLAELIRPLRSADRAGDGLDATDLRLQREAARASERANVITRMLANDLDGDFKVTRAEMERAQRGSKSGGEFEIERSLQQFDGNSDDAITLSELEDTPEPPRRDPLAELLALDPNGDGRLTAAELRRQGTSVFQSVDRNGDELISQDANFAWGERSWGDRAAALKSYHRPAEMPWQVPGG